MYGLVCVLKTLCNNLVCVQIYVGIDKYFYEYVCVCVCVFMCECININICLLLFECIDV